jgi:hypothetical protein
VDVVLKSAFFFNQKDCDRRGINRKGKRVRGEGKKGDPGRVFKRVDWN